MTKKELNGKEIAEKLKKNLKETVADFVEKCRITPKLAIVSVGEDPSAATYIRSKQKACKNVGIESEMISLPETTSLQKLTQKLDELNKNGEVHGIILELPLPGHIPYVDAVSGISPEKDVDGLNPVNAGLLMFGCPFFVPNTPLAVMKILDEHNIPVQGREATIVGRSLAVGKPLGVLLTSRNATVTTCHSKTKDLSYHTSRADILICAAGSPGLIKGDMVKPGAVVIDVGINVTDNGLVGDVKYDEVYPVASLITPVPGGVGPLTVCMILENTIKAAEMSLKDCKFDMFHHRIK